MSYYPLSQQKISTLLKDAFFHYGKTLRASFWFIVLIVLAQNVYRLQFYLPPNHYKPLIFLVIDTLLGLYFWSAACYAAHSVLKNQVAASWSQCLLATARRFIHIVIVALLYVVVFWGMLFWMETFNHLLGNSKAIAPFKWWLDLFLVGLPLLVFMLLFFLAIPIIIAEDLSLFRALARSAKMVWLSIFKSTLVLYAGVIVLFYIVFPDTRHVHWMRAHHVKELFDLFVFLLFVPVLLNYALLLVNNLSLFLRDR